MNPSVAPTPVKTPSTERNRPPQLRGSQSSTATRDAEHWLARHTGQEGHAAGRAGNGDAAGQLADEHDGGAGQRTK